VRTVYVSVIDVIGASGRNHADAPAVFPPTATSVPVVGSHVGTSL
jgi:hypothetical protein